MMILQGGFTPNLRAEKWVDSPLFYAPKKGKRGFPEGDNFRNFRGKPDAGKAGTY